MGTSPTTFHPFYNQLPPCIPLTLEGQKCSWGSTKGVSKSFGGRMVCTIAHSRNRKQVLGNQILHDAHPTLGMKANVHVVIVHYNVIRLRKHHPNEPQSIAHKLGRHTPIGEKLQFFGLIFFHGPSS
jgi:hypothetical protein